MKKEIKKDYNKLLSLMVLNSHKPSAVLDKQITELGKKIWKDTEVQQLADEKNQKIKVYEIGHKSRTFSSISEASAELDISRNTILRYLRSGEFDRNGRFYVYVQFEKR